MASLSLGARRCRNEWQSTLARRRLRARATPPSTASPRASAVIDYLVRDPDNPSSHPLVPRDRAAQCARGAHRADRRHVGGDQRDLARAAQRFSAAALAPDRGVRPFLDWVRSVRSSSAAPTTNTMLRNDAYWFVRLGTFIERADNTARILDVKYHVLLPRLRSDRRHARLLPVGGDPALGLGAARLSLGLPRPAEALADRRASDSAAGDAALARRAATSEIDAHPRRAGGRLWRQRGECHRLAGQLHSRLRYGRSKRSSESGLHEFLTGFIDGRTRCSGQDQSLWRQAAWDGVKAMRLRIRHETSYRLRP